MTKRIFMTAVLLGGMLGVSSFANTFVGGIKNSPNATTDPTEVGSSTTNSPAVAGDYNDLIFGLQQVGMTLSTTNGTWNTLSGAPINQNGGSSTNPFWDNPSLDGSDLNIGFCVTTSNCNGDLTNPPITTPSQYLTSNTSIGLPADDFYFTPTGAGSIVNFTLFGEIADGNTDNEWLGIYEVSPTANAGNIDWLVENGAVNGAFVSGGQFTVPANWTAFGLVFELLGSNGDVYYSQNSIGAYTSYSYDSYTGTSSVVPYNRFALFQTPDSVPEPTTLGLFGLGALALGLIPRLRKRG